MPRVRPPSSGAPAGGGAIGGGRRRAYRVSGEASSKNVQHKAGLVAHDKNDESVVERFENDEKRDPSSPPALVRDVGLRRVEQSSPRARALYIVHGAEQYRYMVVHMSCWQQWCSARENERSVWHFCVVFSSFWNRAGHYTHAPGGGSVPGTAHRLLGHARSAHYIAHAS